ncbi:hypothetical protein CANTEDRAFT_131501 [Yamadazyma tenuis ATCC 10573]|uniref:Lysyl-tRNA synthetase n=1 Tax=Candida tenuis (strain ATCC 10573 / BCRC 21748 / CBS 615 / JCM 9827 / NBRC 10315 / NRRL Y-1498 / VKM Y-70) TaxID=590646 RepID=G3BAN9_CANTC|nr:uncharacterized protein CANTEDRAFT_131501 [Yamadazyma tenuis ATCC 10573]EGV62766.1 hypothetical protein CANTEDRAFT_131501 [Yamadazyma tenuis ATCC 10573]
MYAIARTGFRRTTTAPSRIYSRVLSSVPQEEPTTGVVGDGDENYYPPLRALSQEYDRRLRVSQFKDVYGAVDFTHFPSKKAPELVNLQGKIQSIRRNGKYMYFIDLSQDFVKVQVMASNKMMDVPKDNFVENHHFLRKGDYINCIGHPSVSNTGELSLKLTRPIDILAPCLNSMVVPQHLSDRKTINSNRILNYLVSPTARETILVKNLVIKLIRQFLTAKQFMEFQTPLLNGNSTGANARPFVTRSNHVDTELQLRVAPELWLKKLVISGFERIFEIGSSFRNEGIDATHNSEFTTCEFYQSFTDLDQLMGITQELFTYLHSNLEVEGNALGLNILHQTLPELQALKEPFTRIEFIPTLEEKTGLQLPTELNSYNLVQYHQQLDLEVPEVRSPAVLLDNLAAVYLEPISHHSTKPVFIYNHPAELSPLSKSTHIAYGSREYDISLRFELFINGKEYINAYEEENSPMDQLEKFKAQQSSKSDFNDQEALIPDWNYIKSLEFGLPPTGGWGCGIDRLSMLFTNSERIDQVLPFGNVKDVLKN